MNKSNLFIPGFPKSGTSSLFDYLIIHPEIFTTKYKEPHIYSINIRFSKRFSSESNESFPSLYSEVSNEKYIVDASTTYMISKDALNRIKEDTPNAKIIIIARDPIDRIESHFNWIRSIGIPTKSFKKEIIECLNKPFNADSSFKGNYKNYIEFSLYGKQIENCLNIFPKNQVMIIPFEKLIINKMGIMDEVFNFLEIDSISIPDSISNKTIEKVVFTKKIPDPLRVFRYFFPAKARKQISVFIQKKVFGKKITKYKLTNRDKKWIFEMLKSDIELLDKLGYRFDSWQTTNSFLIK